MDLNLKQQLYLGAVKAAGEVAVDLKPEDYAAAVMAAFAAQEFDGKDYEFWRHMFVETRGRLANLSKSKANSELTASADPLSKPVVKPAPADSAPAAANPPSAATAAA